MKPETKATHTAGPWMIADGIRDGQRYEIEIVGDGASGTVVCLLNGTPRGEANAKLIAAAPELLAACEDAVGYFEAIKEVAAFVGEQSAVAAKIETLRAAITPTK